MALAPYFCLSNFFFCLHSKHRDRHFYSQIVRLQMTKLIELFKPINIKHILLILETN